MCAARLLALGGARTRSGLLAAAGSQSSALSSAAVGAGFNALRAAHLRQGGLFYAPHSPLLALSSAAPRVAALDAVASAGGSVGGSASFGGTLRSESARASRSVMALPFAQHASSCTCGSAAGARATEAELPLPSPSRLTSATRSGATALLGGWLSRLAERAAAPVVERAAAPVVERAASPVLDRAAAPVLESALERAAAPVVERAASPVLASALERAAAPLLESVLERAASPVMGSALERDSSPVLERAAAPVLERTAAPVLASTLERAAAPGLERAASPVLPLQGRAAALVLASALERDSSPVLEGAVPPVLERAAAPVLPVLERATLPVVERAAAPMLERAEAPMLASALERAVPPMLERAASPVLERAASPVLERAMPPVLLVLERAAAPVVERAAFSALESGAPPVVECTKLSTAVHAAPSWQGRPELLTATRAWLAHCCLASLRSCRHSTSQRSFSTATLAGQQRSIDLTSSGFLTMRRDGAAYVDKTGAIVDVLANPLLSRRAFFPRPRRFGKSLTISVMAEMLAAGQLPEGVTPWPGFKAVDINRVFGGLEVHERWKQGDAIARSVLNRAHFVIKLPLGDAQTGVELKPTIIELLADIAGTAFGPELEAKVAKRSTTGSALRALIHAIPEDVPVAVLVDEYDQAIINDVTKHRWAAADEGVAALRSLMMISKAQGPDDRIERFIVTGVARFARTSLFSGANNFVDLTGSPEASRMLGFTEQEIRSNFPVELARLGQHEATRLGCAAATSAAQQDVAIRTLENWYNGYCFDGISTCYNPAPVLAALAAGKITGKEMEGAASFSWLGLAPSAVLDHDCSREVRTTVQTFDIANLQKQTVNATALLLQTGLLSLQPTSICEADDVHVTLQAPNEYARKTLLHLVAEISALSHEVVAADALRIRKAVSTRNHDDFSACLRELLASIPYAMAKMKPGAAPEAPPPREAPYHTCVYGFLRAALPHNLCNILVEQQSAFGSADIVLELKGPGSVPISDVWIVEVGAVTPAANRSLGVVLKDKAKQVHAYYTRYASLPGRVAALVVDRDAEEVTVEWQEWDVAAQQWK